MRKAMLAVLAIAVFVSSAVAVDNTMQGDLDIADFGPGNSDIDIDAGAIVAITDGGTNTKTLTNAAGWWTADFFHLTTPDVNLFEIVCDSCSEAGHVDHMAQIRLIDDTPDTVTFYAIGLVQWAQAGDSTSAITKVEFQNPVLGDTTASGNALTMQIRYHVAD